MYKSHIMSTYKAHMINISFIVFLLFGLFIPPKGFSISCEEFFFLKPKEEKTAQSVFVDFAKEYHGENWLKKMGKDWERGLEESTKDWTHQDAKTFLNFLIEKIGKQDSLQRIGDIPKIKLTDHQSFIERVELYQSYIGEHGIQKYLAASLKIFNEGDINKIAEVIKFIESYLGKEATQIVMYYNFEFIPVARLDELKKVSVYLLRFIEREKLKMIMRNNFREFIMARFNEMAAIERYINSISVTKNIIYHNPVSFIIADFRNFSFVTNKFERFMDHKMVKEKIKTEFQNIVEIKIDELKKLMDYLYNLIGLEESKMLMRYKTNALKNVKFDEFKKLALYLENFIGEKGVKHVVVKDFHAFVVARRDHLETVVSYLRQFMSEESIKKEMLVNFQSFVEFKLNRLKEF